MPTILRFLFPASALLALVPAMAAEPDARNLPLWEAGVGAAAFSTPAYPGASDRSNRWLVVPFLLYRGKVLRADQEGVGARLLDTDKVEFDVGFAGALPAHSNDVEVRRGMPDLGTLVEFGPRVKYKFADFGEAGRLRFDLPVRAVIEARGGLRRQANTVVRLTVVTILGMIGTITTGFLGMNLLAEADAPMSRRVWIFGSVFLITTALTVYTMAKSKRLSDFLDALSDERLSAWTKIKALAAVWKP